MAGTPSVYLFYGSDLAAMREAVAGLQSKLGDATTAEMNTTRLEAGLTFDTLRQAAQAVPFLATRRLVVANAAAKAFSASEPRARFTQFLEEIPESTALVLLEDLSNELEKYWDKNWLVKWATGKAGRIFTKKFLLPEGAQMAGWIAARAKALGGEIKPQAAVSLAELAGSNKDAAEHELQKLLAYVGYQRPIEAADVKAVSLPSGEQGDFFDLIDALSAGNGASAMQALQALMPERDLIVLYFSLVGHFRVLLQSREMLDAGKNDTHIAKELDMHPYRAQKLAAQARRFSVAALETIYKRLLEYDEQIKTGLMDPELALERFVAELSLQAA